MKCETCERDITDGGYWLPPWFDFCSVECVMAYILAYEKPVDELKTPSV